MAVYTKDKQNGARLAALLINQGTDVVRKLFSSTFLSKLTLSSLLTNHESEIRKITNKDQHKLLFPANQASLDKFDLTLLIGFFRNLGHRYSFPYSKKQNNPQTGDHSNAADLTRIRLFRNKLYGHVTTTGVGNDDFKKHWKEIESVLIRLGADKTRIDQFLNDPLDSEMELKYIDMIIEQSNMDVEVMDLVKHVHNDVTDIKKGIKRIEKQVNTTPQERSKRVKYHHSTKKTKRDKELEVKLREELDCHYKRIKYVQPIPGKRNHEVDLNKTYSVLKLVDRKQREIQRKRGKSDQWMVESEDKDIDLEKIFISSDDAETPRRILIEGEAGIGKTSLCRRLAHDWQSQKEYINDRFKFIFLLEGKKCSKSLKEELRGQGLISEAIDCDEMWEYLKNNNEDILWVIDGLDELSISNESEIVKLIKADIFRKSTVIITSRPCMEDLLDPETNYFDRKIINLGFTQETAVSLIKEHFKSKPDLFNIFDLKVLEHFSNIEDLLRNPLMCIILCFLIEEKGEMISNPDINFYQLVRMLSDCLFNRFSAQHKSELTECKDRTRMIAFRGLMQRKHMFTLKDINNIISSDLKADDVLFQTGLFMKELSVTITGDENDLYVFPHKAIQEALAAQYVYSLTDELERKEAIIGISRSRLFWPPVILVYLCVLFTDKNDTDKLKELFNIFVYHLTTHHCPSGQPVLSGSSDSTFIECLLVSNGYQYYAKSWSERFSSKKCILDLTSGTKCKHVAALDRLVKERMFANTITSVKSSSDNDRHLVSSILSNLQSLEAITLHRSRNYIPLIQENMSIFQKVYTELCLYSSDIFFDQQCIEVFKLLNISSIRASITYVPLTVCLNADKFVYSVLIAPDISPIFKLLNQLLENHIKIEQYSLDESRRTFINIGPYYYESFCHKFLPQFLRLVHNSDSTVTASNDKDFMECFISVLKDKSKDFGIEVTREKSRKGTFGDDIISLYTGKCKWEFTFR